MNETALLDISVPASPLSPAPGVVQRVHTWQDPASKIAFLASVCDGLDWQTDIYADPDKAEAGKRELQLLSSQLLAKGYVCHLENDEKNGLYALKIRHLADDNGLLANIHALGFSQGLKRTVTHLDSTVESFANSGKIAAHYFTSDPARTTGAAYFGGDVTYSSQLLHKMSSDSLATRLKGISGIPAALQSLIFAIDARDTGEVAVEKLQHDVERNLKNGHDPLDEHNWSERKTIRGPVGKLLEDIRHHPIEAGSWMQIGGQTIYAAGALEHVAHGDIAAAVGLLGRPALSIPAWLLLMQDPKHYEEKDKAAWYDPKRWKQEILAHPQQFSALLNTGASTYGLQDSLRTRYRERDLPFKTMPITQPMAETQYLVGDAVMWSLDKSHYGSGGDAVGLGAEAAAKLICDSNIVFGWHEEGDFVKRLSHHVGRRIVEDTTIEGQFPDHKAYLDALDRKTAELVPQLGTAVTEKLAGRGRRFSQIAHAAAEVVHRFPAARQDQVIGAISQVLATSKAVYASPEEFNLMIANEVKKLSTVDPKSPEQPTLDQLSPPTRKLLIALPGYDLGTAASRLEDALQSFCTPQKTDSLVTARNLRSMAQDAETLPLPHQLQLQKIAAQRSLAHA